ncbi:MAG: hypothetical protein K0S44_6 [Bacteroidetes bacterium]|jgi:hypothetical protein|nr:hypothetical protein [Bacteroidota bacterium]
MKKSIVKNLMMLLFLLGGLGAYATQTVIYPAVSVCTGTTATLDAGCGFSSFLWSNGATTQTINVPAGTYTVEVYYSNGFSYIKEFSVANFTPSVVNLGPDATTCGNTVIDAGAGFSSYLWSNGQTTQTITAGVGTYTVNVTDANGCVASDNITLTTSPYCSTVPCGHTFTKLNSYLTCTTVPGAINYRFRFYDINAPTVIAAQRTQPSNYIYFNQVPGLMYDHSYFWTVEVEYAAGLFGPSSSKACTITFGSAQTTVPCGVTYNNLYKYTTATFISGAVNYRFRFYDVNSSSVIAAQRTQPSNYIYFNQVSGLQYDHVYFWTVEVQYNNGTGLVWGPASSSTCTITFGAAKTTVPCGNTYTTLNSYTTALAAFGAINYRYTFYDVNNSTVVAATRTQPSNYIYFHQVSGLMYNHSYYWTVEVQYNNGTTILWGPPSSSTCTITFAPAQSSVACGNTYASYTTAQAVSGAVNYRFSFYDLSNTLIAQKTQTSNYIYFNTVAGLVIGQTYNWTVEIEYATETGTAWGPASASSCSMVYNPAGAMIISDYNNPDERMSITENNEKESANLYLNVFPNPSASGVVTIELSGTENSENISFAIYDLSGKIIYEKSNASKQETINTESLETGVYFVKAFVDGVEMNKRVIIE